MTKLSIALAEQESISLNLNRFVQDDKLVVPDEKTLNIILINIEKSVKKTKKVLSSYEDDIRKSCHVLNNCNFETENFE